MPFDQLLTDLWVNNVKSVNFVHLDILMGHLH